MPLKWTGKRISINIILLVVMILMTACSETVPPFEAEPGSLRFEVFQNRVIEPDNYTLLFERMHSDIEVEFVSSTASYENIYRRLQSPLDDRKEQLQQFVHSTDADIVVLEYEDYQLLLRLDEQVFAPLNPWTEQSDWSIDDLSPAAVEALSDPVDRQLYGLTPFYEHAALIYNVDLFEEAGVPLPSYYMSWDELFALASTVASRSGNDRVYGFTFQPELRLFGYSDWLEHYAYPKSLQLYNDEAEMVVDGAEWRELWLQLKSLYDDNVLPNRRQLGEEQAREFHFFNGSAAMSLVSQRELAENVLTREIPFSWDVAPVPADDRLARSSDSSRQVFAIRANAENIERAWKYFDFMLSKDYFAVHNRLGYLSIRQDLWPQQVDYDPALFSEFVYLQHPHAHDLRTRYYQLVHRHGEQAWERYLNGELSVDKALAEWKQSGNDALQEHRR